LIIFKSGFNNKKNYLLAVIRFIPNEESIMNIAFFKQEDVDKNQIQKQLSGHHVEFFSEPLTAENVSMVHEYEIISIFLDSKIDKEILRKMPRLQLISTASTGFDHIDVAECKQKHITVCNVPYYGINTVAEHTFALILSVSRNIVKAYQKTMREDHTIAGLEGVDIRGKTIGVIGTGNIGLHVIHLAKGFGMNVLAFDVHPNNSLADLLGFTYVSFQELLQNSDVVTIHVPYNSHTHHLIDKNAIHAMKRGSILINTSRGSIVENEALIEGLDRQILYGVGLDVIEGEELIKEEHEIISDPKKMSNLGKLAKDHILLKKNNVVFTPHIGFYSKEAIRRLFDTNIQNILTFIQGKPQNVV
jgi:D-lactate dehydrogenase